MSSHHRFFHTLIIHLLQATKRFLNTTGVNKPSLANEFSERFKYLVISSSLLSSSLPIAPIVNTPSNNHETDTSSIMNTPSSKGLTSQPLALTLALLLPAAFARGNVISGIFLLAAVKVLSGRSSSSNKVELPWNAVSTSLLEYYHV